MSLFDSVLIANRGEIARRVMRTCRALDIRTIAVYSDADADAPHVRDADVAVRIGPPPVQQSYLNARAVLDAARQSGADAIHPGYGFLSENATFAEAVIADGFTWIGPPPEAIRLMGDKAAAKALMVRVGVPVVAGFDATAMDDLAIVAAAEELGFPILLKAAAGGGGKGMRSVHHAKDMTDAIAAARREALAAFGDDRLIVERLIERPRHIEVQVFADTHGNMVHLFERECSIQRRHQKIIEESPSPIVDPSLREQLGAAALDATKACDYVGAGTVEFILDPAALHADTVTPRSRDASPFSFLEMNTRLQVEHPVTELVTGVDLVAWQLQVAAGNLLPATQTELRQAGHAIEVRVYAEDPATGFLPQTGRIARYQVPQGRGIRTDSGVDVDTEIAPFYDPMLAKVIVHANDRSAAITQLATVLSDTVIHGVTTNLAHLQDVIGHSQFVAGALDTGFLERLLPSWSLPPVAPTVQIAVAAVLGGKVAADRTTSPSPTAWQTLGPWRLSAAGGTPIRFTDGTTETVATVRQNGDQLSVTINAERHVVTVNPSSGTVVVDGAPVEMVLTRTAPYVWTHADRLTRRFTQMPSTRHADAGALATDGALISPMPGTVLDVRVVVGDLVSAGDVLVVVEAMKMEHRIVALANGTVTAVHVRTGLAVEADTPLLTLAFTRDLSLE